MIKIPKEFIFNFAMKILREAGFDYDKIEENLENFIYEAGEKNWEEGENNYYIEEDDD